MRPSVDSDRDLLIASGWVAGARVSDTAVLLTHILGRRRLVCSNLMAEILLQDFQNATTIEQVARRRNAPAELIRSAVDILRAALLIRKADVDEVAAIRHGLDIRFAPAARYDRLPTQFATDTTDIAAHIDINTPLQLASAITAMHFGGSVGGVITHVLEGPLLLEDDLWQLAMAFRDRTTLRQAISSARLQDADINQLVLCCQFLARRRILCTSQDEDVRAIAAAVSTEVALVEHRFTQEKNVRPASYEDAHFVWYQPYGYHGVDSVRALRASGRVAFIGQCQSHFIAGTLEFLAQQAGWHLQTHGWFEVPSELATQSWSLIVLPTVVEAASFYEAFVTGDIDGCRNAMPQIVAEVNRSVCLIREKTDAPILVIGLGEPSLHAHAVTSQTRHALRHVIAQTNESLLESVAGFERVHLLDESAVLSRFADVVTLDDEYNAAPHHCGFDLWSWKDHPFDASRTTLPEKPERQIHPAWPLAQACLEHLCHLYASPRIRLIVFEPNGLLWPGSAVQGDKAFPQGINVYTGLNDFVHLGIHEALITLAGRGIRLACVSSSDADSVEQWLQFDSDARNLVRREDVDCVFGGDDKHTLLKRTLEQAGIDASETLWIDPTLEDANGFDGLRFDGPTWQLRRYLLRNLQFDAPASVQDVKEPPAATKTASAPMVPGRSEIGARLDAILSKRLNCPESALRATDDLRLLGLDSVGCAGLVLELEESLGFRLPDRDYIASVMFSRNGLLAAIARALESGAQAPTVTSPDSWFAGFTRERWCEQDIGTVISHHFENPCVGWILKLVRSANPFDYQYVTWRELYGTALGYTRQYRQSGLAPGDTVTILLPQGLHLFAAVLGAILGGVIPSVSAFPSEKLSSKAFLDWFGELVQKSRTRCVVCREDLRELVERELSAHDTALPVLTSIPSQAFDEPVYAANPDAPALLQHSSGTTGIRKGVRLSHRALLAQIWDLSHTLDCNDRDVIVSWLPYYHDMGLIACLMLPLLRSLRTVVMSPFDWVRQPHLLLRQISEEKGTLCWLPNFAYLHCANRVRADQMIGIDLSSLRAAINCSEPITHEAMTAFYERFGQHGFRYSALSSSYAMAENTFAVTQTPPGLPARIVRAATRELVSNGLIEPSFAAADKEVSTFVSSGRTLPGASVRIVGDAGIVGDGQVGEIRIKSHYLFSGYDNDDESTRGAFDDGWYKSGDLGFMLDGELFVTGRSTDLIIVAGHNVYPHDVETEATAVTGIKAGRAVAFGVDDALEGTQKLVLLAELELTGDNDLDEDALKATIRENVLSRCFVSVDDIRLFESETLKKSTSGKLARAANRALYLEMIGPAADERHSPE